MSVAPWRPAYVALGSNLDDPVRQVRAALGLLAQLPETRLIARSRLWRTPPFGPQAQPAFVNAAAGLLTRLTPEDLLAALQRIEQQLGKVPPPVRWGPRRIDLDLLAYAAERRDVAGFRLPHPGVPERAFVLYPLAEFAPALVIPGFGRVSDLVQSVSAEGLEPLEG